MANNNKYKKIIIDANNLFWRSWSVNTTECIKGEDTIYNGGIELFLNKIQKLRAEYGYTDSSIYLLFDNPTSTLKVRQLIDEDYKSHRLENKYSKELYRTMNYLIEVLRNYFDNCYIVQIDNCEADDLVNPILEYVNNSDALLVSADLDWARSISEMSVHWYNYKKIYDLETFYSDYKFYPNDNRIKLYKAIRGDRSDNIQNAVPYLPEDILLYIVNKYNNIHIDKVSNEILRDEKIPSKWRTEIKNSDKDIRKNYQLVDFISIEDNIEDYIQVCKRNKALCRIWFTMLSISHEAWMLDIEKPDDFLSIETFKKVRRKRRK